MLAGIKVVTNAGGLNPMALKKAIEEAAIKAKVPVPVVGVVVGDDLMAPGANGGIYPNVIKLKQPKQLALFLRFLSIDHFFPPLFF